MNTFGIGQDGGKFGQISSLKVVLFIALVAIPTYKQYW